MVERSVWMSGALLAAMLAAAQVATAQAAAAQGAASRTAAPAYGVCAENVKRNGFMRAVETNDIAQIRRLLARASNPNQRLTEPGGSNFHEGPACSVSALTLAARS